MTVRQHRRGDKTLLGGASYGQLPRSHTPKEDTDVLPPPGDRMDQDPPDTLAPLEPTTRHRLGLVEPGDGAGSLWCVDRRPCVPGDVAGPHRAGCAPAVARVLLRSRRPTRDEPLRAGRGALLCAAIGLGRGPVGGHAIGPGP